MDPTKGFWGGGFLNPGFGDETELEVLQIDMGKVLSRQELLEVARLLSSEGEYTTTPA